MIQLTRLNHHPLVVNSDLIKFVEQAPDTVITLLSGEKIVVLESARDVLERVVHFRRSVLQGMTISDAGNGSGALPVIDRNVDRDVDRSIDRDNAQDDQGNPAPVARKQES